MDNLAYYIGPFSIDHRIQRMHQIGPNIPLRLYLVDLRLHSRVQGRWTNCFGGAFRLRIVLFLRPLNFRHQERLAMRQLNQGRGRKQYHTNQSALYSSEMHTFMRPSTYLMATSIGCARQHEGGKEYAIILQECGLAYL